MFSVRHVSSRVECVVFLVATVLVITLHASKHGLTPKDCWIKLNPRENICNFSARNLTDIPKDILATCQFINLSYNRINTIQNYSFAHLRNLTILDLSENELSHMNPMAFWNLQNLVCLDLRGNKLNYSSLVTFPELLFQPLMHSLNILYIQRIGDRPPTDYPDWAIGKLAVLTELYMDLGDGIVFGRGFSNLKKLIGISTEGNPIPSCSAQNILNDSFAVFENTSLQFLVIRACGVINIGKEAFKPLAGLHILDLSENKNLGLFTALQSLFGLQNTNMSLIVFRHVNVFSSNRKDHALTVESTVYLTTICLNVLDFSDNRINWLDQQILYKRQLQMCLVEFYLQGHLIHVPNMIIFLIPLIGYKNLTVIDISGYDLHNRYTRSVSGLQNASTIQQTYSNRSNFTGSIIQHDNHTRVVNMNATNVRPILQARSLSTSILYLPPALEILNISNTLEGTQFGTPLEILNGDNLRVIDVSNNDIKNCSCSYIGLFNLTVLNISNIDCSILNPAFLQRYTNLHILTVRNSRLNTGFASDPEGTFLSKLSLLTEVDLGDNGFLEISDNLFSANSRLQTVRLSNNKLEDMPKAIFNVHGLRELDLSFNTISVLNKEERQLLDTARSRNHDRPVNLDLMGNPLICTCSSYDFIEWMLNTNVTIVNLCSLRCSRINGSQVTICSLRDKIRDLQISCVSKLWLAIGLAAVTLTVVLLVLAGIVYRYRLRIQYFIYSHCSAIPAPPQPEYDVDVFIAFSHTNAVFVVNTLKTFITGLGYDVRLFTDFLPGSLIGESITQGIRTSRKVIIAISRELVSAQWGRYELEMVRMRQVQDGHCNFIIPIMLEDIPMDIMPNVLRQWWNTVDFLIWPESVPEERHFWEKLEQSLRP